MTFDHIGYYIFYENLTLRIIGRLAFPIFAYMIAEGCKYTRNKLRYLSTIFIFAVFCQVSSSVITKILYMNIFVTFALSVSLIFVYEFFRKRKTLMSFALVVLVFIALLFIALGMPKILPKSLEFEIDYGIIGILCPFLVYVGFNKVTKLALLALGLIGLSIMYFDIQWFSLFALIPLFLYSGKRGRFKLKYLFYFYYPLHIGVICLISYFIGA